MNRLTQYYRAPNPADSRYVASEELKEESTNQCSGLGNRVGNSIEAVFNKLGKLEDLEEELGCPIEILFKALNDGVYTDLFGTLRYIRLEKHVDNYLLADYSYFVAIKNYRKTWWLREDKSE